jgi:hypothetical protein
VQRNARVERRQASHWARVFHEPRHHHHHASSFAGFAVHVHATLQEACCLRLRLSRSGRRRRLLRGGCTLTAQPALREHAVAARELRFDERHPALQRNLPPRVAEVDDFDLLVHLHEQRKIDEQTKE